MIFTIYYASGMHTCIYLITSEKSMFDSYFYVLVSIL